MPPGFTVVHTVKANNNQNRTKYNCCTHNENDLVKRLLRPVPDEFDKTSDVVQHISGFQPRHAPVQPATCLEPTSTCFTTSLLPNQLLAWSPQPHDSRLRYFQTSQSEANISVAYLRSLLTLRDRLLYEDQNFSVLCSALTSFGNIKNIYRSKLHVNNITSMRYVNILLNLRQGLRQIHGW